MPEYGKRVVEEPFAKAFPPSADVFFSKPLPPVAQYRPAPTSEVRRTHGTQKPTQEVRPRSKSGLGETVGFPLVSFALALLGG